MTEHTVATALELINQRFRDVERLMDERHANSKEAVATALDTAQREIVRTNTEIATRFGTVNEFREQLADQAATFMPRAESDSVHREINVRVDALEQRIREVSTRIDRAQGADKGAIDNASARRATVAQIVALAAVFLTAISVAVGVILAFNG